jgi:hypothetical protein
MALKIIHRLREPYWENWFEVQQYKVTPLLEVEYRISTGKYKNICPLNKTVFLTK